MRTSLRKMGNSTGMIVPRSILGQIGVTTGATMDLRVEDGRLIASPVETIRRDGWAAAASAIDTTEEERAWQAIGSEQDADLTW